VFADDLVKECIFFADDFTTDVDVEVFKGHREEVGSMDFSQRFQRRSGWACVVDAAQVCSHIQHTVDWMISVFRKCKEFPARQSGLRVEPAAVLA
jgi:hypothetical protein